MNSIYKKLAEIRVKLQSKNLKKSGKNKFAGYSYYELGDFLPYVNELCNEIGLLPTIYFDNEEAIMIIYDFDSEKTITFRSKVADATTKGQLPIQSLGSIHTYMRRYLYLIAFEIVEHDFVESVAGSPDIKIVEKPISKFINEDQAKNIFAVEKQTKYGLDNLKKYMITKFKKTNSKELTVEQYQDLIMEMESKLINEYSAKDEIFEIQEDYYGKD